MISYISNITVQITFNSNEYLLLDLLLIRVYISFSLQISLHIMHFSGFQFTLLILHFIYTYSGPMMCWAQRPKTHSERIHSQTCSNVTERPHPEIKCYFVMCNNFRFFEYNFVSGLHMLLCDSRR